jgi:hypothetical protein
MTNQEKRIKKEIRRLKRIIDEGGVSDRRQKALEGVIQNAAFMRVSLDDTIKEIADADVVVEYDNGGGQTGIRENPLFNAYEKLFGKYLAAMNTILESLPAEAAAEALPPEEERPKTMLELIREKRNA